MLQKKNIVVGVTGGIAAYKACYLVRELCRKGAVVRVIMTRSATEFVTPLTFSTLSQNEVIVDLWPAGRSGSTDLGVRHVNIGVWADAAIIAPASANTMAKLACGIADNALTTTVLALRCPLILAPSMDLDMWNHPTTQSNVSRLKQLGYFVIPPGEGALASGLEGPGRLAEPDTVIEYLEKILQKTHRDLTGKSVVVTAGPTREPIDPVRFISNWSSGKMGFAMSHAASLRGADVTLITGPVQLATPRNVERVDVVTAEEMKAVVFERSEKADIVVMSAAVSDFAPIRHSDRKIKKTDSALLNLKLQSTTDILQSLGSRKDGKVLVGFALETENEIQNAKTKLQDKNLDLIVVNNPQVEGAGFDAETNVVSIIDRKGVVQKLEKMSKFDVAMEVLDRVVYLIH
ncbi:MAG: bifunctional phosphopantothenoylcysteine decarboxylase/phosphopantothenate--cysteine ligase CoaBC [Bacteroidota bacterium]